MQDMFCERLRAARKRAKITQIQLSRMTMIDQAKVSRLETGGQEPSIAQLRALAVALSVSADWLIGLVDDQHTPGISNSSPCVSPSSSRMIDALDGLTEEQIAVVLAFIAGLKA